GDGRPFCVISEVPGSSDEDYFKEVYNVTILLLCKWRFCPSYHSKMINTGTVKMTVVSNFDSRLRKLLKDLNVLNLHEALINWKFGMGMNDELGASSDVWVIVILYKDG
ncbi:hypothetical protein S245_012407, partial [Arachis hypogaea]